MLRYTISVVICVCIVQCANAQSRPNVDTLTLCGMHASQAASSLTKLATFDTLFWSSEAGMLRSVNTLYGHTGEYRVAVQDGKISQVTFAIGAHNKDEAKKFFTEITSSITSRYGEPDVHSVSEIRWEGIEQFFAV